MTERSTEELEYKSAHAQPEEKTPYTPRPKSHIILAWVLLAIVVIGLWNSAGINVLIYTAALRNIPHELLEAAAIDGAGRWRMFRTIILPMISSSFTICITLTFTGLLKEFGTVMAATGGGPAMASSTICMYIYNCLFSYNRAGYGQAVAISFMAVLVLIGTVLTNFFRKREVEL